MVAPEYAELLHGDLVLLSCPAWAPGVTALAVVQGWDPDLDLLHLNADTVSNERVHLCVCVHANRAREGQCVLELVRPSTCSELETFVFC